MLKVFLNLLKRPWVLICALTLMFVVPLVLAIWLATHSFQHTTTNYGKLITPPIDFTQLPMQNAHDQKVNASQWHGRWLLVYVSPVPCGQACHEKLYDLRQIHTATGKDRQRIQRVLVTLMEQPGAKDLPKLLNTEYAGTYQVNTFTKAYLQMIHPVLPIQLAKREGYIFIVDPHGNLILVYKPTMPPMDILKDLTHLLGVSQIG